ncbi:uncharacterized protein CC84DRAFT_94602 [Paraphaeosphaeria sporulosa]|uniref:Uncharacterized protein n=1 Tax=Paraphaeosphaeria sporulosa TaxID=1460663 RepID=A0A177CZZ5_9PLEO|nr:uncharacterized protein CC84DRAFT_94602 [Paraphaeosphaeria sporulosa]OAG12259.1 hypothetical protein CC84DRAFT_94602 [Paraphaeosphaeria sporulosa]
MALPKGRKGGMVVIGQRPGGPACAEGKGGEGEVKRTALTEESLAGSGILIRAPRAAARDARLSGALGGMLVRVGCAVELQARANGRAGPWLFRLVRASGCSGQAVNWLSGASMRGERCAAGRPKEACFKTPACRFAAGQLFTTPVRYFRNGACQPISRLRGRLCFKARRESF